MSSPDSQHWHELPSKLSIYAKLSLLVCVALWIIWLFPFDDLLDRSGTPLGGDFVMYYTAGQVAREGRWESLYDDWQNQLRVHASFPELEPTESWPFRYPPAVAAAVAPLAGLSYPAAFSIFLLLQFSLLLFTSHRWYQDFPLIKHQPAWLWVALANPVVIMETLLGGQASLLALACVTAAVACLRTDRQVTAGACLAVALYKPNVLWLVILGCLLARPRILLGLIPTALGGLVLTMFISGEGPIIDYLWLAVELGSANWSLETPYWKVHGLVPLLQLMGMEHGRLLAVAAGGCLAVGLAFCWRRFKLDDKLVLGLLLACNSLFNPYVPIYDLVLLAFAALLLAAYAQERSPDIRPWHAQCLLLGLCFGPHLSQMLCKQVGVQLYPLWFITLAGWFLLKVSPFQTRPDAWREYSHAPGT
jgi:hypothetical protein